MDKELQKIIADALKAPNPKCPKCNIEGTMKGGGEVAWCECPKCKQKIGETTIM